MCFRIDTVVSGAYTQPEPRKFCAGSLEEVVAILGCRARNIPRLVDAETITFEIRRDHMDLTQLPLHTVRASDLYAVVAFVANGAPDTGPQAKADAPPEAPVPQPDPAPQQPGNGSAGLLRTTDSSRPPFLQSPADS